MKNWANGICRAFPVGCVIIGLTAGLVQTAWSTDQPPPVRSLIDANGVNLIDGSFNYAGAQVVIGQPGQGGLSRAFIGGAGAVMGWSRDSLMGTINSSGTTYTVSLGAMSRTYNLSGGIFTPLQGDGSTLVQTNSTTYTWTLRDGTKAVFSTSYTGSYGNNIGISGNVAQIVQLLLPSGEVDTYSYTIRTINVPVPPPYPPLVYYISRLESVTNNFGYQIKYLYQGNGTLWFTDLMFSKIIGINNAVDYCAPTATSCPNLTVAWPSVSYNSSNAAIVTDTLGRQTTYPSIGPSATTSWIRPSGATVTITTDSSSRVLSVANGVGTWTYQYATNAGTQTTTVTDPLGHTRVVTIDAASGLVKSDADGLSHTTSFAYDSSGRLTKVTRPEGDSTAFKLDARGNVTQTTVTGKDGTSTLITTANYDASCTSPAKCNQPNWTQDARGFKTLYSYNSTTGQILSIIRPAGANGLIPETDFTYSSQYAWYKNSAGSLVQAASPVSLLTKVSTCTNAQSCAGSANAIQNVLTYGSSGVANNLLITRSARGSGDGTLVANTGFSWDAIGNPYTQTDPLGHVTRFRYDAARQLLGVVGPDPDAGGGLLYRALRLTYQCDATVKSGCDGLVTLAERGTVTSQLDSAWSGFVSLGQVVSTYDSVGRKSLEKAQAGSTPISVSQYSYDSANRLSCRAIRMNPATLGSLPSSACSLGTSGAAGPDRITAFYYDNADRLLKSTSGYGTSVAADDAVYSYGNDDELVTQADGKGNLTGISRDTFNRVTRVYFPTPANGSVSSSTDYEQYSLDANGNITQIRRRDGTLVNLGYDALNLPVSGYNGASFAYDNAGRMTAASLSGLALGFTWDALNRQISESSPQGTITRQFDLNGNRTQLKYPGTDNYYVNYGYDAVGELTSISDPSSITLMSLAYDNLGRPSSISRYQGPSQSLGYGSDLRLSSLGYSFADTSKNVTLSYTYNLAGQPVSATASNAAYRNTSARAAAAYASDGLNRYTAVGASSLTYDGRSNLSSTGLQGFGYDGLNRLTSTTGTTLVYDALDRLNQVVSGAGTKFLYEGQQIIAEYNGSGALQRRYIPGPGLDNPYVWFEGTGTASNTARWLLGNAFGSIIAVGSTGAANTTLAINQYDEFGVGPTGNLGRFQYKGMTYIPEVGLYHARARTYSQYLGRFMQTDPSGYSDGMNLYAFVHNGPINGRDVLGLLEYLDEATVTAHRPHRPSVDSWDFDLITELLDFLTPEFAGGGREGDEPQVTSRIVKFLCHSSAEDGLKSVLDNFGTAASGADVVKPAIALGAMAASVARSGYPAGTAFLGGEVARGLSILGRSGGFAAKAGVVLDVMNGDFQAALYDSADYIVYSALADVGATGAIETAGGSVAATGFAALNYYMAGGMKGIVQSAICH